MSIAVLARKSRTTAPRLRKDKCFVLNMTGRGGFIGQKTKPNNSKCSHSGNGHASRCCSTNIFCEKGCWPHSKPAPQLSYGNYNNRKSKGAYRPGGGICCSTTKALEDNKIKWKKEPNISASKITQQKKDKQLSCFNIDKKKNKYKKTEIKSCSTKKNFGNRSTDLVRYTRSNHSCGTTKFLPYMQASDIIAIKRTNCWKGK